MKKEISLSKRETRNNVNERQCEVAKRHRASRYKKVATLR